MSDGGSSDPKMERVQEILTALLKQRLTASLDRVESAIAQWKRGEAGIFDAHKEVLRHVARSDVLAAAASRLGPERTESLLRSAHDLGIVGREELVSLTGKEPDDIAPASDLDSDVQPTRLPAKREVGLQLLEQGAILVHVDPRRPGVSLPDRFGDDPRLVLRFGYGLTPAIADLDVGDEALRGTLSFSGIPHECVLPWTAVYAIVSETDQRGMVWPDDVPPEVLSDDFEEPTAPQTPSGRSHLKLVD